MLGTQKGAPKVVAAYSNSRNSKPERTGRNIDG